LTTFSNPNCEWSENIRDIEATVPTAELPETDSASLLPPKEVVEIVRVRCDGRLMEGVLDDDPKLELTAPEILAFDNVRFLNAESVDG
jgi:hypothetical protein